MDRQSMLIWDILRNKLYNGKGEVSGEPLKELPPFCTTDADNSV